MRAVGDATAHVATGDATHGLHVSTLQLDAHHRVVLDYGRGVIVIQRPPSYGGTIKRPMAEYDEFAGNIRDWVASLEDA